MLTIRKQCGLTLVELIVVVAILAILAGGVVPLVSQHAANGRQTAANASLTEIRNAIVGTPNAPGYLSDTGQFPATLRDLFIQPVGIPAFDRNTNLGWRGPYLLNANATYPATNAYGTIGDPALLDPWGNPFILQIPTSGTSAPNNIAFARIISAGPNGIIDTSPAAVDSGAPLPYNTNPYPLPSARGDDLVLFVNHSDSNP